MKTLTIRFYEELNDFLPKKKKKQAFQVTFSGRQTVKDIIEAQGVPHAEVDLVLTNGISVDFGYIVNPGDIISVYPVFETLDISSVTRLRKKPLRNPKFILDVHLGRLVKYLRLLGFDTIYRNDFTDNEIIETAATEDRIILTRDVGILKRNEVNKGYWIRNQDPKEQVKEVVKRFDLYRHVEPFKHCLECNGLISKVSKESIQDRLLPGTRKYYDTFYQCPDCQRIYWEGSHYQRMLKTIREIKDYNNKK